MDIAKKFERTKTVHTYDCNFNKHISFKSIMGYMQEMATAHDKVSITGKTYEDDPEFVWILRSSNIELYEPIMLDDTITMTTWPVGMKGLKALRQFDLIKEGRVVGIGRTHWVMYDIINHKVVVAKSFLETLKQFDVNEEDFFKLKKIRSIKEPKYSYTKIIRNHDIDWNNHTNNTRYAEIIYDAIPYTVLENNVITELQIDFHHELTLNQEVDVYHHIDGEIITVEGKVDEQSMFKSFIKLKGNA